MAIRIVRLGSPRAPGEGLRVGTVRRPPRGAPTAEQLGGGLPLRRRGAMPPVGASGSAAGTRRERGVVVPLRLRIGVVLVFAAAHAAIPAEVQLAAANPLVLVVGRHAADEMLSAIARQLRAPASAEGATLALDDTSSALPSVSRATAYARQFADSARVLLATEHYEQQVRRRSGSTSVPGDSNEGVTLDRRTLDSEVALVHTGRDELWMLARDVLTVNGRTLSDRERVALPTIPTGDEAEALRQFRRLAEQGARYNIGGIHRDLNVPTLALWLLTPAPVERLQFRAAGTERIDGTDCEIVGYEEARAPYLFTADGRGVPVRGRLWIASTGAVLRTEFRLEDRVNQRSQGAIAGGRAVITVDYAFDRRLEMWVPRQMVERYDYPQRQTLGFVLGIAQYRNYRRFEVGARIVP